MKTTKQVTINTGERCEHATSRLGFAGSPNALNLEVYFPRVLVFDVALVACCELQEFIAIAICFVRARC
jgi:hypothetical protein